MLFFSRKTRRAARPLSPRRSSRLQLERLETRLVLSSFTVTNVNDSGAGSLRQAILEANASDAEADVISFNIPGDGVHTIAPLTALPIVWGSGPITIDATTQPGYDPAGLHTVELSGQNIDITDMNHQHDPVGLNLQASNSLIKGLSINRFATGIVVGQSGNRVEGNYIGLDPTGTFVPGPRIYESNSGAMYSGIILVGQECTIGGASVGARNVISGNYIGIWAKSGATDNHIVGNYFSTDKDGLASPSTLQNFRASVWFMGVSFNDYGGPGEGNRFGGVEVSDGAAGNSIQGNYLDGGVTITRNAHDNLVGGSTPAARNVLGRVLIEYGSHHNKVQGNYIGVTADGSERSGVGNVNVWIGHDNIIGTDGDGFADATEGNVIGGGVQIFGGDLVPSVTMNNVIAGNLIGTDATGMVALGPHPHGDFQRGILVASDASSTRIGTNGDGIGDVAERNVISGGWPTAVETLGESTVITGNYIGTDRIGGSALPNGRGVDLGGSNSRVGSNGDGVNDDAERNVISGNQVFGVQMVGALNVVAGNYVGTDATGMMAVMEPGGRRQERGVQVGGGAVGGRIVGNVISGNEYGLYPTGGDVTVHGNLIGTDRTGNAAVPNGTGIFRQFGSEPMLIGGTTPEARNIITGNDVGIRIQSDGLIVHGNYIGRTLSGVDLGNGRGIWQTNATSTIGGSMPGEGNVISGASVGIDLTNPNDAVSQIQGNLIVRNWHVGVSIATTQGSGAMVIGGTEPGSGNTIAYNGTGVFIGDGAKRKRIVGNSIHSNTHLGIDIDTFGVDFNDPLDSDAGANGLQNFPVLGTASSAATTRVQGSLHSTPYSAFVLDFYASTAVDPSGYGEGERWLGSATVNTLANGDATFDVTLNGASSGGEFITATATDSAGNTSEFSLAVQTPLISPPTASVSGPAGGVRGQVRSFIFGATDASPADEQAGFTYLVSWGDGSSDQTIEAAPGNGAGVPLDHTFVESGTYQVQVTATDAQGATSEVATHVINVVAAAIQADPLDATKTFLVVGGTLDADIIKIKPGNAPGEVKVVIRDAEHELFYRHTFDPTIHRIVVYGQAGNDDLVVNSGVAITSWLYGGDGDDRLKGGVANDVLLGGAGDDLLHSNGGRDMLIGGAGADKLVGDGGDDLLVSGYTAFDALDAALAAIQDEWTSARSYAARVANLRGNGTGPRLNGGVFLLTDTAQRTVFDDGVKDTVTGGSGQDWFLLNLDGDHEASKDKVTDLSASEFADDLDFINA